MRVEIDRLQTENWQLRQACGYPIPADKETIHNPFKCGICDARSKEVPAVTPRERNDLIYLVGASVLALALIWGLYWWLA